MTFETNTIFETNGHSGDVFVRLFELYSYPINISILNTEYFSLSEPFSRQLAL